MRSRPFAYCASMKTITVLAAVLLVLSACGSDSASTTAEPSSADTSTPSSAVPDTTAPATSTAPAATSTETPVSPGCEDALGEAEDAVSGVMDILDAAETTADLDTVDPDAISAAFEVLGEVVGTACAEEPGRAVSHLITFTADEGDSRSEASAGFAAGFIPELCQVPATLTSGAAEACAALDGP